MLGPVRILEQLPAELSRTVHPDDLYQYSLSDDLISYYQLHELRILQTDKQTEWFRRCNVLTNGFFTSVTHRVPERSHSRCHLQDDATRCDRRHIFVTYNLTVLRHLAVATCVAGEWAV